MNSEYSPKNLLGVCCFLSWWREGDGNPAARFAVTFPINWNSCCKPSTDDGWLLGTQHHSAVSTKSADCHLPLILASRKRRLGWAYWVPSEVFFLILGVFWSLYTSQIHLWELFFLQSQCLKSGSQMKFWHHHSPLQLQKPFLGSRARCDGESRGAFSPQPGRKTIESRCKPGWGRGWSKNSIKNSPMAKALKSWHE